jgi:ankyrin repeat protein
VKLNDLIHRKVDLEFTYNLGLLQRTPVMLSLDNENMLKLLLEKGANINGCNAHGLTPLKLGTESPIRPQQYQNLLKHPTLTINQQNKHGESTLLRCLMRRKHAPSIGFIVMIIRLLNAGADPELANNAGVTPMDAARQLGDVTILNIIQEKIDQKHALIQ